MTNPIAGNGWRPTRVTLIAAGVVLLGVLLTSLNWGFVALIALGALGPGILRELGWLNDQDEFQRRAAHRAGYHAYLIGGLVALLLVAYIRSGERQIENPEELATLFLVLLWFTWFLSSLLAFWGPRRTASRVLIIFGSFWLLFNILGNLDSLVGLIMQSLVAAPFFVLAYLARRWPRIAGVLLLAASGYFFYFFDLHEAFSTQLTSKGIVLILFLGPLIASGIALLREGRETDKAS